MLSRFWGRSVERTPSRDIEAFQTPHPAAEPLTGVPYVAPYTALELKSSGTGLGAARRRENVDRRQTWHDDYWAEGHTLPPSPNFRRTTSSGLDGPLPPCINTFCRRFVVDPTRSTWVDAWDMKMVFLLLTTAILTPYETAFLAPTMNAIFVFDRVVDMSFLLDMILQFFLAYPDPRRPERLIKAPRSIMLHYLTGWFIFDLLSLLPVDLYCIHVGPENFNVMGFRDFEIFRMVRLVRLLRLARWSSIFDRWHTSFGITYAWLTLLKFFASVVFCCHWMACLWGGIAVHLEGHGEVNWLSALRASKGGQDSLYQQHGTIYGISLYWAIITLTSIGYGDITPQSGSEYWVCTICASIMAAMWAYVIGSVCTIVSTLQPHEMHFKRTMDDLNWLLADRKMPTPMCKRLRRYFHEAREMSKQRVEETVIDQMSPTLQGEFAMFLHQRWIKKVWYLSDMNREIIIWAARNLSLMIYAPHEEIIEERTLFIVRRGVCAHRGRILTCGDIWGEDMLLSNDVLRDKNKARSLSYLSVLRLGIADLFDIVVSFPEAKARLRWAQVRIATQRGVVLVAQTLEKIKKSHNFDPTKISFDQLSRLYTDILTDNFHVEELHTYQGLERPKSPEMVHVPTARPLNFGRKDSSNCSLPGLEEREQRPAMRTAGSVLDQLSAGPHPNQTRMVNRPSDQGPVQMLGDLMASVAEMRAHLVRVEAKVDRVTGGSSANTSKRDVFCRNRSRNGASQSNEIDFGTMVSITSSTSRQLQMPLDNRTFSSLSPSSMTTQFQNPGGHLGR